MRALRERNFRLLFIGKATSSLGDWFVPVAIVFAVLRLTHSAADLGYVLGTQALAQVTFVLAGGVIADRFSRRWLMMGADSFRGLCELILGASLVTAHPPVAVVGILGAAQGLGGAVFAPAASGLTANVVPKENLQQANALIQTAAAVAAVTGPAIAGVCVVTIGAGWAIFADGVTFGVNVIALAFISIEMPERARTSSVIGDLKLGWAEFFGRKWFRTLVFGASLFNLLYGAYNVMGPVASVRLYGGAAMWATAASAAGLGAIAGGLAVTAVRSKRERRLARAVLLIGLYALAPLLIVLHLGIPAVAGAAALGGAGMTAFSAIWTTVAQQQIPEHLLSRVMSFDYFGSLVALPAGYAISGALIAVVGVKPVLWVIAAVQLLTIAVLALSPSVRAVGRKEHSAARTPDGGLSLRPVPPCEAEET
ncbi:MAG TPA: MFS transporter [Streptosporangiaceae bacterium]|nr:MFS transporter [Streptosporangiaceae bacterium]